MPTYLLWNVPTMLRILCRIICGHGRSSDVTTIFFYVTGSNHA